MGEYWEPTAQMFSSLFEKPKMTEKLLTKPPFKYLFDIITETRKATGFGDGLYSEQEQDAGFYEDKNRKMFFLEKTIFLASLMNGEEIEAKPNKIVAGVEPEKTNEFLQAMYKAAVSGENSQPFVTKVLTKLSKKEEELLGRPPEIKQDAPPKKEDKKEEKKVEEPPKKADKKKPEEKQPAKEEPKPEKVEEKNTKMARPPSAIKRSDPPVEEKKAPAKTQEKPDPKASSKAQKEQPKDHKNDDDDVFIQNNQTNMTNIDSQQHGAFVRDALKNAQEDQKKEEEPSQGGIKMGRINKTKAKAADPNKPSTNTTGGGETFAPSTSGSSGDTGVGDVEAIQKLIQSLTQNTNPLKRSVDFVSDDIESMNKEMEYWRNQYLSSKAKYQVELRNTEESLQPLQNKCAEIEEQIKEKKLRIQNVKAQILQNEQRISNLLYSVVTTK